MINDLHIKDKSENSQFLKASPFRKTARKTEPHKHNHYFEIIYLARGKGSHTIDNRKYEVRPPVIFFIRYEQVHHWDLDTETEPEGYVLILKKLFFEKSVDGELKQLLAKISRLSCVCLDKYETIQRLFELLVQENATEIEHSFSFSEAILKGLFVKILQIAEPVMEKTSHQRELYLAFTELLISDHPKKNKVAHYAGILNTTPQNLNAVCRKALDQSAAGVLAGYIIDEAKRLLIYTDHTITEIAFNLSFKDPSHFVKYFKRYTGHTPQTFRSVQ
jgi:AraC-like DNA-binding protein